MKTIEEALKETTKIPYGELAWRMGEVMKAMNDEEAYYNSGWLYSWPDGMSKEDCLIDFADRDSYYDLKRVFRHIYSDEEYREGGLYTDDVNVINYAREFDREFGLKPIEILHDKLDENTKRKIDEKYSDEELEKLEGKVFNIQKISNIYRRKKYDDKRLLAHTVCVKCSREKTVFLSNLVNDPDKYGSCICSDTNIDAKIDTINALYTGKKKLSSNTSGYTGVSFVKTYKGQPYNKWRAYIEVDGVRTYLGDFTSKTKAIKARKEAGEKGVKWYKENRNKLMRDVRRRSKKYKTSKYRETQKTRKYAKAKAK